MPLNVTRTRPAPDKTHHSYFPLAVGSGATTEILTVGGASVKTTMAATAADCIFELEATEECWFTVGADPTAAANGSNGSRRLPADTIRFVYAHPGDKVAVIQPAA